VVLIGIQHSPPAIVAAACRSSACGKLATWQWPAETGKGAVSWPKQHEGTIAESAPGWQKNKEQLYSTKLGFGGCVLGKWW